MKPQPQAVKIQPSKASPEIQARFAAALQRWIIPEIMKLPKEDETKGA